MQLKTKETEQLEFTGKYVDSDRESYSAKKKKIHPSKIIMNVSDTQYPVVKFVGKKILKWNLEYTPYDQFNFDLCWTDNVVKPETLSKMQSHQKINHFPGMGVLSRKNNLGRNLMKLRKLEPEEYNFFPMTFVLPGDYNELKTYNQNRKQGKTQTFIVKPEAGCQGRGIYLTRHIEKLKPTDRCVVQRYLHKPFLIDGLKFDFRIYVLLSGTDPLRIFIYEQGLARFATEAYVAPRSDNLDDVCMHLTNYAINKDSPNFVFNESEKQMDKGHKRSLTSVYQLLKQKGYDVDLLKSRIQDIIIKTIMSGQPVLHNMYKSCQPNNFSNDMCFELLGFDIIIDSKFNPILLQINYTPSFSTDTPLDSYIKKNAIRDTLKLINISEKNKAEHKLRRDKQVNDRIVSGKRKKYTQEERYIFARQAAMDRYRYEDSNLGGFKRIFPVNDTDTGRYAKFLKLSQEIHECPANPSLVLTAERIVELERQISKTSAVAAEQSSTLRATQTAKLNKSRDHFSTAVAKKISRPNNHQANNSSVDSKMLMEAGSKSTCELDSQFKQKLMQVDTSSNKRKTSSRKTIVSRTTKNAQKSTIDHAAQEITIFSNQNLKKISGSPNNDDMVAIRRGAFQKKRYTPYE